MLTLEDGERTIRKRLGNIKLITGKRKPKNSRKRGLVSMYVNCIVDTKGYHSKPTGADIGGISNRLATGKELNIPLQEFKQHLEQGKTYLSGHYRDRAKGRSKGNFKNINFFSLDVDNHYQDKEGKDIYTDYTEQEAINHIEELLNTKPILSYQTFSKYNKANNSKRFRLVYGLDSFCTSKQVEQVLKYITLMSGNIFDKSATDSSRLFFSTSEQVKIHKDFKLLDECVIDKLSEYIEVEEQEQIKEIYKEDKKKATTPLFKDAGIEELKTIDLGDYLANQGYNNIKKTPNGYKMPCPIHKGVNDNFSISLVNGTYLYKCFSKCRGAGGTIIDLHAELNNLDTGEAIQELKKMYDIKDESIAEWDKDTYTVDKYISEDKDATKGIMDAIETYNKTLITGSMGTGKTHFVLNNVYKYSTEINKTLIIIIPNVSQLSNLYTNKNIPIVCQTLPQYFGNDIVATTPESLPKITEEVGADNYILVVDETHERYTSSSYRQGYKDGNIEKAEQVAYKSIHLTATPRLLGFDNFDKEINIKSKQVITNDIDIYKVDKNTDDAILNLSKRAINRGLKPIIFNNNKEVNAILKEQLEKKEKVKVREYKENQLNIFDKPTIKEVERTVLSAETVESGKIPESIAEGKVIKDSTITTSSIQAGIDLYTDENAILIVNTRNLLHDNMIQLIGRFRKGIKIILVVEDREHKKKVFDLNKAIKYSLRDSQALADSINNDKDINHNQFLIETGVKKDSNIYRENDKWKVDKAQTIRKVYEVWSKNLLDNIDNLKELLKEQDAFKVESIKVMEYEELLETSVKDAKDIAKEERKQIIDKASKQLLGLHDSELEKALAGEYKELDEDLAETVKEYKQVAHRHLKQIRRTKKELFPDDDIKAFRHYYSNTWADIRREIKQKDAKAINRNIKENGLDKYTTREMKLYKDKPEPLQAKIRKELQDLEAKQGRLSQKRLEQLTATLYKQGYIYNKYTKILKTPDIPKEDKEKAFKMLGDIIKAELEYIYNFRGSKNTPLISSVKY